MYGLFLPPTRWRGNAINHEVRLKAVSVDMHLRMAHFASQHQRGFLRSIFLIRLALHHAPCISSFPTTFRYAVLHRTSHHHLSLSLSFSLSLFVSVCLSLPIHIYTYVYIDSRMLLFCVVCVADMVSGRITWHGGVVGLPLYAGLDSFSGQQPLLSFAIAPFTSSLFKHPLSPSPSIMPSCTPAFFSLIPSTRTHAFYLLITFFPTLLPISPPSSSLYLFAASSRPGIHTVNVYVLALVGVSRPSHLLHQAVVSSSLTLHAPVQNWGP